MSALLRYLVEGVVLGVGTVGVLYLLKTKIGRGISWRNIWVLLLSLWSGVAIVSWYLFATAPIPPWGSQNGPAKMLRCTYLVFALLFSVGSGIGWFIISCCTDNKQDDEAKNEDIKG